MRRPILAWVVTLLLGVPAAAAGESRASADASVDRSEALVGDPIQYTVTVKRPQGARAEWPSLGGAMGDCTVEASGVEAPHTDDGMTTEARWYRLAGYSAGPHTIPEMVVTLKAGDGATRKVRTQAVAITVKSLLPSDWEQQDIREVKPLIPVRSSWWWLLGVVALIGGAVGAWERRRRRKRAEAPSAPLQPPHEIACEALSKLRQEDFPSRNRYEEYYVRLSGIIRAYIEARFGLKAPEMTTEEFLHATSNAQGLSSSHRRLLQEFLERCDLVKFARYEPSRPEADEAFEAAHRFIQDTAPSPEPVAAMTGNTA